jgi:hypothetical protein
MVAYLLLLVAVLTRVLPHAGWMNFTAVGGALLYFGARRPWREMLVPLVVFMATDYFLTVFSYHYAFRWQAYVATWAWYLGAMALGQILLSARSTFVRVGAATVLGPTSFFVISNYAVWAAGGLIVSAHSRRARSLLCCCHPFLPQRSRLNRDCSWRCLWRSRSRPPHQCAACATRPGRKIVLENVQ